MQSEDLVLL